jgi:CspA family cold shock protein
MTTRGTVRAWHDAEGWGVVDSPETPGGCWVHFSHVLVPGHRTLRPGQEVELEHEAAAQDGHAHRAVRVWPAGSEPVDASVEPPGGAYTSTLSLTLDDDPR